MSSKPPKYGIFAQNVLIKELTKGQSQRTALLGQIVKIESLLVDGENVAVRFLKNEETWESTTFSCRKDCIISIDEKLWQYLAAVSSPVERVKLAKDREHCTKLLNILCKDYTVGFQDVNNICLGRIKFLGLVKGIGKCIGLQLHEKKQHNKCDGSCAGITYFSCLPGYGIFTTIERIVPINNYTINDSLNDGETSLSDLDVCLEKSVSSIVNSIEENNRSNKGYEEIVTKYGEYPKHMKMSSSKPTNYIRNSLSLQNIIDVENRGINTNNDFDQNTVIQPDKTYLINDSRKARNKSEMDLIDVIGGSWTNSSELNQTKQNVSKRNLNNCQQMRNGHSEKHAKPKTTKQLLYFFDSTNTLPRKHKFDDGKSKSQFYVDNEQITNELNEKSDLEPTTSNENKVNYKSPEPGTTNDLTIGSVVEILNDVSKTPLYGVIRWMGVENETNFCLIGVELEEECSHLPLNLTDGTYNGERYFKCGENRAFFVPLEQCHKDSRFQDNGTNSVPVLNQSFEEMLASRECPAIEGAVAPLCMATEADVEAVCGKGRGIQGHHNSCYLDVTLFSMFTYTAVFDSLLFRPKGPNDIDDYDQVQRVLREEIVNPLRKKLRVSADNVMKLRKLLDRLSSVSGLTSEEKDPEEFLNCLLAQILKAEPFLKLNSGQESFYYQLFVEKDADLTLPTVQQLFEQSFLTSNIKLKEVPSCLIIQMPRFGKNYKMYPRILPSQLLDVTDVIEGSPRQCMVCGKLARWECRDCFDDANNSGLEDTAFCVECLKTVHRHERRLHHKPTVLDVSYDFSILEDHCRPPRLFMELFAVICIETSHYVAFVKCGVGQDAPWCFFDSMADRKGEKNGYNIPEMVACPDVIRWLSDERICRQLHKDFPQDRHLPEHARRLLCDAYICMYQSSDVMMYR